MNVFSVNHSIPGMFDFRGRVSNQHKDLTPQFDLVVFWGGEDIGTKLYDQNHYMTSMPTELSPRDRAEVSIIEKAIEFDIPMVGICRGAQLLCAYFGGKLFQDVTGHGLGGLSTHAMKTIHGKEIPVTSTHHQMMIPGEGMNLIGWSEGLASNKVTMGEVNDLYPGKEAEIVSIPYANALCVQGHPEYLVVEHVFPQYVKSLIKEYLDV